MKQSLVKTIIVVIAVSLSVTCASAVEPQKVETQDKDQVIQDTYCADWAADALPDSDELFAAYVEQQFYGDPSVSLSSSDYGGSKLSGLNKKLYDALKVKISQVAAGEVTSTIFDVTATADSSEDSFQLERIIRALLVDCPYELFWYDKTVGASCSGSSSGNKYSLSFRFSVSPDYGSDYVITKDLSVVHTAVQNALEIVEKYASVSDYEKLLGYRNELCDLTEYNSEAAESDYSGGYGDPWQMIYMFDGDPDTKVVCEGYAKAFQYLCDETDFVDDGIQSYLVSGTLASGSGSGGHMWNVVHMDDGFNYLVDVTGSDSLSHGEYLRLFLAGTDTGDVASGYTFSWGSTTVGNTVYSGSTLSYFYNGNLIYTEEELTLASSDYSYIAGNAVSYDPDTGMLTLESLPAGTEVALIATYQDGQMTGIVAGTLGSEHKISSMADTIKVFYLGSSFQPVADDVEISVR